MKKRSKIKKVLVYIWENENFYIEVFEVSEFKVCKI